MLARAIDARKRLFMKQTSQIMPLGDLLHSLHDKLVRIAGDIGRIIDCCQFMLSGGHLVVLGLGGDAQLPKRFIKLVHK